MVDPVEPWPIGVEAYMTATRKKINNPPLQIGDIVTPFLFYKNGRPIQSKNYDYQNKSKRIGVVVGESLHPVYNDLVLEVRWTIKDVTAVGNSTSHFIKSNSGSFLVKLS
jgi:hypothetical protein